MGKRATPSDRNLAIWERRRDGATLQVIGEEFGLTRERIRQIVWKTNLILLAGETVRMHRAGVPIKEITCTIQQNYGFTGTGITAEMLQHLISNRFNLTASLKGERTRCETCVNGCTIRRGHVYECHHPDREAPYRFYGKTRPHNCPILRSSKAPTRKAR